MEEYSPARADNNPGRANMGVGRRPGERLFFGETAAALLIVAT